MYLDFVHINCDEPHTKKDRTNEYTENTSTIKNIAVAILMLLNLIYSATTAFEMP